MTKLTSKLQSESGLSGLSGDYGWNYQVGLTKSIVSNSLGFSDLEVSGGVAGNYTGSDTRSLLNP